MPRTRPVLLFILFAVVISLFGSLLYASLDYGTDSAARPSSDAADAYPETQFEVPEPLPVTIPKSADAYHYDGELTWTEWWYFNFIDDERDLQMFIMFVIMHTGMYSIGVPTIEGGIYNGDEFFEIREMYTMFEFEASKLRPDVRIAQNTMKGFTENYYEVKGSTRDGSVVWDLSYNRTILPFDPPEGWREMNYLVYMPGADVTGTLTLDGVEYEISGAGYHDHNWGAPPFSTTYYKWGILYEPHEDTGMIFERIEFGGTTLAAFFHDGETVVFDNPTITYDDFQIGMSKGLLVTNIPFPVLTVYPNTWRVTAQSGEYSLEMDITALKNIPVYMGGLVITPYVINEQISEYNGVVKKGDEVIHEFSTLGFTEFVQ